MSEFTKNMTMAGGPKIAVKKVDHAELSSPVLQATPEYTGADRKAPARAIPNVDRVKGDPVKATMDAIMNPPEPRDQMRGQQNSRHYKETGKGFKSNMFVSGESAGG